jgi:hypothetical protein
LFIHLNLFRSKNWFRQDFFGKVAPHKNNTSRTRFLCQRDYFCKTSNSELTIVCGTDSLE